MVGLPLTVPPPRGMAPPLVTTDFLVQDDGKGSLVIQTHMCGTLTY